MRSSKAVSTHGLIEAPGGICGDVPSGSI